MIDFYILSINKIEYNFSWNVIQLNNNHYLYYKDALFSKSIGNTTISIIGDVINKEDIPIIQDITHLLNVIKGNYYAFLSQGNELFMASSAFGLLPIYYSQDFSVISSSVNLIKINVSSNLNFNKKWLINQLLFNYQFGCDTFFKEIKLFPAMSYIRMSKEKNIFVKYYNVKDEFLSKPIPWGKALPELSREFIEIVDKYIPENKSLISFTGGFDGRTLVSIATYFKKKFSSFSYGKITNDDVYIPLANSKKLKIPYFWLDLNEEYSKAQYYESAKDYIINTDGSNGFLYAHVDYLASCVNKNFKILMSGICGSELFRAVHASGAITSKALIDLFREDDIENYRLLILKSETFKYINIEDYKEVINEVIEDTWKYKILLTKDIDKNKSLYTFVYEEVFRKFFGPWVKSQMHEITIRTPYIDFQFFKKLIKTEMSGAYSDFLTNNPLKRYKGQVFYAEVIRLSNKKLFWTKTGKGYSPAIVNLSILRPLLAVPFFSKRLNRSVIKTDFDNLGIITGIKQSIPLICKLSHEDIHKELLRDDLVKLLNTDKESYRDTILMTYSILLYNNYLHNEQ